MAESTRHDWHGGAGGLAGDTSHHITTQTHWGPRGAPLPMESFLYIPSILGVMLPYYIFLPTAST